MRPKLRLSRRRLLRCFLALGLTVLVVCCTIHGDRGTARSTSRPSLLDAARVHGLVTKGGPLAVVSMLAEGRKWNDLLFPPHWIKQRLAGDKADPPSKYCNPMINDKYKLIYLKCPKTAGTTVMDGYFSHCDVPKHYDYCLHMADYTNTTEVDHLLKVWDEYFVFGFSRNVLRRAVSQYHYLVSFVKEECGLMSWDTYCEDPYLIGDICAKLDANGESCCTLVPEHQYLHVSPQANCLLTEKGRTAVDWIGKCYTSAFVHPLANWAPHLMDIPLGWIG